MIHRRTNFDFRDNEFDYLPNDEKTWKRRLTYKVSSITKWITRCVTSQMIRKLNRNPNLNFEKKKKKTEFFHWRKKNFVLYRPFSTISLIATWITKMIITATKTFRRLRICEIWKRSVKTEFLATKILDSLIWRCAALKETKIRSKTKTKTFEFLFSSTNFGVSTFGCWCVMLFWKARNCSFTSFSIRCSSLSRVARIFYEKRKRFCFSQFENFPSFFFSSFTSVSTWIHWELSPLVRVVSSVLITLVLIVTLCFRKVNLTFSFR